MTKPPHLAPTGRCSCGKQIYPTKVAAENAARRSHRRSLRDGPVQAYRCAARKWHIGHGQKTARPTIRRRK